MGMTKLGVKSCLLMSRIAHAITKIPRKGTEEREFGSLGFGQKYTSMISTKTGSGREQGSLLVSQKPHRRLYLHPLLRGSNKRGWQDEGGGTNAAGKCLLINQIAYERTETARNGKKERELWILVRNKHFNKMGSV